MQLKPNNVEQYSVIIDDRQLKGNESRNRKTCHEVRVIQKISSISNAHYLIAGNCKKTLIKLSLHKGRARKNRFRVMSWLYLSAGNKVSSKQKFIYKVIPKEVGSSD